MNPLPAKVRKFLYRVQYLTTGATTLTGVGFAAAHAALPQWYGVTVAVLAAGWTYLGMTATANTSAE